MIEPTPGRVVWYWPAPSKFFPVSGITLVSEDDALPRMPGKPLAAHIAAVWGDTAISVAVLDILGNWHPRQNVYLWHGDGDKPVDQAYCEWMPYQKGQAAKTEALEKQIGHGG